MSCELRIEHINAATMNDACGRPCGLIEDAVVLTSGAEIEWVGPRRDAPSAAAECVDGRGGLLTPGLIDCHTHLVYGGNRVEEFEARLSGAGYGEILQGGGGILTTVRATQQASADELTAAALKRLENLIREGVTTVEIKSGYGLNLETESKMIDVMHRLETVAGIRVQKTFLGAHAVPFEYHGNSAAYIDLVCDEMLPALASKVDCVDVFCESIAFSAGEAKQVFAAARRCGLPIRVHAEQLAAGGGAALAADCGALSADHLEYIGKEGVRVMAENGTSAVLLPGAFYFLGEKRVPPIDLFRRHRVPMAVATDSNPGSSPCLSLLLMLNMACTLFRLTPAESLAGVTKHAARALGLAAELGSLEAGKAADMALFDVRSPAELAYTFGANPCRAVWRGGRRLSH